MADPDLGPWFVRLGAHRRLLLFDYRGAGLSRPTAAPPSLDGYVDDATAVIAAAAVGPVDVFAQTSSGCWVAVELAVRHPELIRRLVLYQPTCTDRDGCRAIVAALRMPEVNWELFTETSVGQTNGWALSAEAVKRIASLLRASETLDHMQAIARWGETIDATDAFGRVACPTLGLRRAEPTPVAAGKATDEAARLIPGVKYAMVPGSNYLPYLDHPVEIVAAIEAFLDDGGATSSDTGETALNGLSVRETEVLRLIAAGESNAQIAEALTLSPHTVSRHVSNIFAKIGARNRAEATAWAIRHGFGD